MGHSESEVVTPTGRGGGGWKPFKGVGPCGHPGMGLPNWRIGLKKNPNPRVVRMDLGHRAPVLRRKPTVEYGVAVTKQNTCYDQGQPFLVI